MTTQVGVMGPIEKVFTVDGYELLELAYREGFRNPGEERNPILEQLAKNKKMILLLCAKAESLLYDGELWQSLEDEYTLPRALRVRQFIVGNIIKGVYILHKEKARRFYDELSRIKFVNVYLRKFNKKLDKVVVVRKLRKEIQFYFESRFHVKHDEELWNRFLEGIMIERPAIPTPASPLNERDPVCVQVSPVERPAVPTHASALNQTDSVFIQDCPVERPAVPTPAFPPNETDPIFIQDRPVERPAVLTPASLLIERDPVCVQVSPVERPAVPTPASPPNETDPIFIQDRPVERPAVPEPAFRFDDAFLADLNFIQVVPDDWTMPASPRVNLFTAATDTSDDQPVTPVRCQLHEVVGGKRIYVPDSPPLTIAERQKFVVHHVQVHRANDGTTLMEQPIEVQNEVRPERVANQLEIPGIVVTELERTRTDSFVASEIVPEMEGVPRQGRETGDTTSLNDLMRDDSAERARRKRRRQEIPICFTPNRMERMINRTWIFDKPTLFAEVRSKRRPNFLSPLRLLYRDLADTRDVWEAPNNYVDVLKKNLREDNKLTLQQLIPFSYDKIFERLRSDHTDPMTEEEQKTREMGQRTLNTILNVMMIPYPAVLRFYIDGSPTKTRPSVRRFEDENQSLDIPGMARNSPVPQPRESQKSPVPDAAIPPRPSIEPYLMADVLDQSAQRGSIMAPLPPSEPTHVTLAEEELGLHHTEAVREPIPSAPAPTVAAAEDFNPIEVIVDEARQTTAAPSRLETAQEQISSLSAHIVALEKSQNLIEGIAEVANITMPEHTTPAALDVNQPEAVQQPRPSMDAHIAAPEDVNRTEVDEEPIRPRPTISREDVIDKLKVLFRRPDNLGSVNFLELCPDEKCVDRNEAVSCVTAAEAARTFFILLELHAKSKIRLENGIPISDEECAPIIVKEVFSDQAVDLS